MDKKPIDFIDLEHLTDEQAQVAGVIGIKNYRKLCTEFGGARLYIPKSDSLVSKHKKEIIKALSTGRNQKEICQIFGITKRELYNIVSCTYYF